MCLAFLASCAGASRPADSIVSLSGEWQLVSKTAGTTAGALPAALQPPVAIDVPFDYSSHPDYKDFDGCVILRRALPPVVQNWMQSRLGVAIDTGYTSDTSRYYLNEFSPKGLIGAKGSRTPYASGYDGRVVNLLPASVFRAGSPNFVYAEICTASHKPFFWRGPRVSVGRADAVFSVFALEVAESVFLAAIYLSVGLYHLVLAARRWRDIFNLYFGIFATSFAFFHLANTAAAEYIFGPYKELQSIVDQVALMIFVSNLLLFISRFFLNRHSRTAVGFATAYTLFAVADLFVNHSIRLFFLQLVEFSMVVILPYILFLTVREAWRGNRDALLLLGGVAMIVAGGMHDLAVENRLIHSVLIMPYTFLVFILGIAFILANRFVRLHSEVEELNASLEGKVRRRTEDLNRTLDEVRALKHQQDGDYFLTSQLLQPLAGNHAHSSLVGSEILVRQKKSFQFRKWHSELGGDLCAVHSLSLRGRPVLVFFNGDAMGKSMQGAGGALIMGTVFKAIVTRTQKSPRMQEVFPEHWLRQCYQELRSVFVAFDGRMMISMIVGLVDEETGLLYFVNAEHPHVVLYRDDRADFVHETGMLRKIGVEDPSEVFAVQTLQLKPNDAILIGSDGRDDIRLGTGDDGNAIINDDENVFLRFVEEAHGELPRIDELIRSRGQVIDDLSLIRITYKEDFPALEDPSDESLESGRTGDARIAERRALRSAIEAKNYRAVAEDGPAYLERYPDDNPVYLWVSYALAREGDYQRALDFSECLYLRNPEHEQNLRHLERIQKKIGIQRERTDIRLPATT